jgi:UDPglucose 6-dehydrogenase
MIGTGYVGLVSGVCLSDFGHNFVCVNKDPSKIEMLESGNVLICEPDLDELMAKVFTAGWLSFSVNSILDQAERAVSRNARILRS